MNTWIVGHAPGGYWIEKPKVGDDSSVLEPGQKIFFMRGRIMAGQADLKENLFGLTDFKWLTRQEVGTHLDKKYFSAVEKMMTAR
jgi:large subunit ribosomal protein L46